MDKNMLISALIKNGGINPTNAAILADDLVSLKAPFDSFLERWLNNPDDLVDYELEGIKISALMDKAGLKYPAALSTMNWILDEGQIAVDYIKEKLS